MCGLYTRATMLEGQSAMLAGKFNCLAAQCAPALFLMPRVDCAFWKQSVGSTVLVQVEPFLQLWYSTLADADPRPIHI